MSAMNDIFLIILIFDRVEITIKFRLKSFIPS